MLWCPGLVGRDLKGAGGLVGDVQKGFGGRKEWFVVGWDGCEGGI